MVTANSFFRDRYLNQTIIRDIQKFHFDCVASLDRFKKWRFQGREYLKALSPLAGGTNTSLPPADSDTLS